MKKLHSIVVVFLVAATSFGAPSEPKMQTLDLGGGILKVDVPVKRIMQFQRVVKPEDFGLAAKAKAESTVYIISEKLYVEVACVQKEDSEVKKIIELGSTVESATGKTLKVGTLTGMVDLDWSILKWKASDSDSDLETCSYRHDHWAFEIKIGVLDLKDKKTLALKQSILDSVRFNPPAPVVPPSRYGWESPK